jgi:hypothetical protein
MNPAKKSVILHPYLIAAYTALLIFSHNFLNLYKEHILYGTLLAVSLRLLVTWLLLIFAYRLLKDRLKAGIIVSLFLMWFFFWGYVYEDIVLAILVKVSGVSLSSEVLLSSLFFLLWTVFFILCAIYTLRKSNDRCNQTRIMNAVSLSLIIIWLGSAYVKINILMHHNTSLGEMSKKWGEIVENTKKDDLSAAVVKPDIYYLILDTYASYHTLNKFLGFDNDDFYGYLKEKGFYIAEKSLSNYSSTLLSLATSLNMEYLGDRYFGMLSQLRKLSSFQPHFLIAKNKVEHLLSLRGYKSISIGWGINSDCGKVFLYKGNKFIETTGPLFFESLLGKSILDFFIGNYSGLRDYYRQQTLYNFSALSKVIDIPGPKFVFFYIRCPHRPFVFGPDGQETHIWHFGYGSDWKEYISQLKYVNQRLKELLELVLSKSDNPPVIILQGDHGLQLVRTEPLSAVIEYSMPILNAYYLPGEAKSLFYDSITPVNTFRLLFNYYFKTHYDLLEDRSWFSNSDKPYDLVDVTGVFEHMDFIYSKEAISSHPVENNADTFHRAR